MDHDPDIFKKKKDHSMGLRGHDNMRMYFMRTMEQQLNKTILGNREHRIQFLNYRNKPFFRGNKTKDT